ncbi:MAG: LPD38 domain-containing protein [Oscillospiraceae bacterium]
MRFLEWDKKDAQKKQASMPAAQKMPLQPPLLLTKSGVVMADGKGGGRIITPQAGHNTASAAPVVSAVPTVPIVPALPAKSAVQTAGSAGRTATPQKSEAQRRVDNLPNIHAFGAGDYTGAAGLMEKAWQTGKAGVLAVRGAFKEIEGQATPVNREQHLGTFSGFGDLGRAVSESRRTGESIDAITDRLETERLQRRERQRQATYDRASELFEKSAQAQEQANEGLGTVGRFMVDMGVTGIQMAGDALVNLALPGGGLYMMGLRSYGQAANEARREGKSEEQQFVAGLKSAGIETLTEKMFGAFGKIYGKAGADELVEKLVTKLTSNKTGQALLTWIVNGAGEGVEEVTSDLLNPLADRLLKLDDGSGPMFTTDDAAQMGYDFLLGAAMGLVGGTGQLNRGVKQGKAQTAENAYYENLQKNGLFGGNSGQLAQRAIDAMGRAMPGEYAKLPRLVDARGTTYEQQQAAYRGAVPRLKNENGLLSLTEQERVNLSSGAKNKVVSTFQDAVQFVRNALANKASVERAYMGKVPESTARRVMQETGINIDGMGVMMNGVDVRHIIKSHGDPTLETARGQVMVTAEAIAHIPEIIAQPDAVYLSETNDAKGRKAIVFEKRFGDTYITVQGVSNGKNLLQTDTLYIQKGKTRTSRYSMPDIQENAAPEINAQSAPPQGPSYIDTSIPQGTQGVNAQDMRNGVKYAELPRLVDANGMDAQQRTAWLGALEQMPQAQRNQFETAAQIAKRFGAAVQAQTMQEGVQGSYQNGVIYIDPAAVDPVRQVLIHELTHHMETSGLYGKFSDAALRFMAEDMGADVDALRRTVIEDYAKAGVALDEDGATRELVAKFAEEKLFTDEATVRRMLAQDRNLFQRIYDWLRDTAAKLTGTPEQRRLIDAQNLYEKALRQAEAGTQGRGTQYDIRELGDGRKYVQADRQVIFGNDPESWSAQLEDYINGKIRRGQDVQLIAEDGDVLTLTRDSAGKLADNHTGDGRTMSESAFERKVNAASHIDELAQISMRGKKNTPDYNARHGAMAADGWNYRTAYFRDFDGRYYKVTISTALNPEGTIIYNVGHMKEEAFPKIKGSYAENGNGPRGNASTNSISTGGGNVNTEKFSTGRSIEEMAGVDTGRTVQENGLYRRDTGDAASKDAISWRDVYGVSDRVAPPDMTMEPVSAQDAAEQNAYMERLARDENIIGDDPYTVSDAIYDAQLRRLEGQEAPPERTVEQTTQADLDDLVRLYADQADPIGSREDRIKATESMVTDHTVEEKKSAREKARETWSYLYRKMVDAGHSVSKVSEAVNDPYLYQFYNQARASTSAGVSMIADAQTNVNAQKVGESLNGIFSPIRQKGEDYYHAFQIYMFDLHNIDRMSLSQNKEQAVLDARAALRDFDVEHPEVRTDTEGQLRRMTEDLDPDIAELARERLRLLRAVDRADAIKDKPVFGVDVTAEVSRERARRALQEHPEFEQYREQVRGYIDNLMQYRVDSGLMTQENADFLKKFYPNYVPTLRVTEGGAGAGRERNAVRIGKTVGRAQGGTEQLVPLHEALGKQTMKVVREGSKNRFGQRILQDYVKAGDSTAVRRYIKDAQQFDGGDFDPDTLNDVGRQTFTKEKTFTVFQDGKLWELTVDDTLFDALKALSPDAAESNTLTKTIRASNNLFKSLVTGYNPTFLVRNTVRDLQTAGLYTRDGKAFLKNYPKALAEIKNNGEYWQMYKALGGSYSSVFDYATGTVKEPAGKAGKLLARLEALNMATEQAPRLAEFMSVVEKGGVNSETLADALYAAADVTVNFGRAGTLGKVLNANYVPFLNPGIQGFDKMIRRVTETKGGREWAKLVGRAVVLGIAPTLLNALLYHDDEEWDDLRDSDKDTNYMFKLKDGIWLKLPKGRELSLLGITADRVTDAVKGENVDILATLNTMGNQVAPANPLTSNIASALVDSQLLNPESPGRTWYGGDIENQRLQSYAPGQRYDSSTDVFSKAVGGALGISPKKLNYVLDQYTGVVGDFLLPALTPQAERGMFAKAFTTDVVSSNRVSGDFFDEADELTYAKNGGDETAAVVSRFWSKQQSACSDLWKEIREVEASELSDKEKRQKTRELKAVVTGIQKNALAVEETYRAAAEKFLRRGLEPDDAYREANRECFGAEYALQTYNKDVYQRAISAKSNGVSYEDFYTYYFGTKGIKATGEKSAVTQKFEWLRSSGMSVTAQAEIYFADMASDTTLEQLAELESSDVITPEQFYQYKVATSGLTKKAEKLEAINMLELDDYQKDALYYLNGWAQSTIGQAPWVQGVSAEASANRLAAAVAHRESQPEQTPQWQQNLEDYLGIYEQRRKAAVAYIRGKQALESEDDDIYAQRRKAAVAYIRGRQSTSEQGDIYEQRRQAAVAYIRGRKG